MDFSEILAYVGGLILSCCIIPQVYKSYKSKSTDDLSLYWLLLYILGLNFILVYGYYNELYPIAIPGTLEVLISFFLLYLKIKYSNNKEPENVRRETYV